MGMRRDSGEKVSGASQEGTQPEPDPRALARHGAIIFAITQGEYYLTPAQAEYFRLHEEDVRRRAEEISARGVDISRPRRRKN